MVDLTTLEGKDTAGKVESLCRKALTPDPEMVTPKVAAVCVYPSMVKSARRFLGDSGVRIASVATAFPSGQYALRTRLQEVKTAVQDGADEIDMVINRGAFLAGDLERVQDEIASVLDACGLARLKVILEVSELETFDNIRAASFIAMQVLRRGDFIKTSTGKTSLNATLANNQVMIEAIRDFYLHTGIAIGMKPGRGNQDGQTVPSIPDCGQRNHGRCLVKPEAVPLWRQLPFERPAHAIAQTNQRRLPGALEIYRCQFRLLIPYKINPWLLISPYHGICDEKPRNFSLAIYGSTIRRPSWLIPV